MAKTVFFKKSNNYLGLNEEKKEMEIDIKENNTIIIDRKTTQYIIDNFSDISLDIRDSLINLANTLENVIDYIEDKSSEVIKKSRNFKLSQLHREKSIEIYKVVENINNYVSWMNENYKEERADISEENEVYIGNELCIYEDFTDKNPKAFRIDEYYIKVSDWKELISKAADVITKRYRNSKNDKEINVENIINKVSLENDFRNSVIDILKIYNIPLDKFYVYV